MGYLHDLQPVPLPVRELTDPPYFSWRETGFLATEYSGLDQLAAYVRKELAAAKNDGRLPKTLKTLVSLSRSYGPKLSLTIRGLSAAEMFDEVPAAGRIVGTVSGVQPDDNVRTDWVLNRDWAFVFLQAFTIANAYNVRSSGTGDDYPSSRYTCSLYVKDAGFLTEGHLRSIVGGPPEADEANGRA